MSGLHGCSSVPLRTGAKLAMLFQTRWIRLASACWKLESGLRRHRGAAFLCWTGTPDQGGGEGSGRYPTMRRCDTARELHRKRGELFAKGQYPVPRRQYKRLSADASHCVVYTSGSRAAAISRDWASLTGSARLTGPGQGHSATDS